MDNEMMERRALLAEAEVIALRDEVDRLKKQVSAHCDRIAAQSELLSRHAEDGIKARQIMKGVVNADRDAVSPADLPQP